MQYTQYTDKHAHFLNWTTNLIHFTLYNGVCHYKMIFTENELTELQNMSFKVNKPEALCGMYREYFSTIFEGAAYLFLTEIVSIYIHHILTCTSGLSDIHIQ